ncbi:MAG: BlaI/MecI/CopY family transcriptional regulator [Thermoleophilaceae bacterium]
MAALQGELQLQVMSVLWRLEAATVEQVRGELPDRGGAYTTVQTVLNRLADRGLLTRQRVGNAMVYRPSISESEYLTSTLRATLAGASRPARHAALAELVGELGDEDLAAVRIRAQDAAGKRRRE